MFYLSIPFYNLDCRRVQTAIHCCLRIVYPLDCIFYIADELRRRRAMESDIMTESRQSQVVNGQF